MRKWVSKQVIARLHGVSERTVENWMAEGIVPYRKHPSGMVRFHPPTVEAALGHYDVEVEP